MCSGPVAEVEAAGGAQREEPVSVVVVEEVVAARGS